jgi:hypothetical protein
MATLLATIIARDQPRFSNSAILRRMIAKIKELSGRNRRGKLPRLKRDRYVWKYRCSLNREIKNKVPSRVFTFRISDKDRALFSARDRS